MQSSVWTLALRFNSFIDLGGADGMGDMKECDFVLLLRLRMKKEFRAENSGFKLLGPRNPFIENPNAQRNEHHRLLNCM